ncbi:hypothetical protein KQ51_00831 [Candidatus Izimaplasma bacterium HR1]|jgi:hypothetical protein|uniref:AAA family ATPase n=1 Tax=Candidatus Izimoplasma sp. HR1 TaxID=1541959 RepID=UPI0004F84FEB|nr:hypothetical protein KQ51_00831 [Candidatus Izimaplasma bacterium HR1]
MDFIIIFGPQAVGKMTVGEELAKKTGYKLFHNHMTIDLVLQFFTWEEGKDLIYDFRQKILKKMAKSNQPGLIFTYVWAFDMLTDWDYIDHISNIFRDHNVCYIELNSGIETRLDRNQTHNRLEKKWTKLDIEASELRMLETYKNHRTQSFDEEVPFSNYIRIENTNIDAKITADIIIERFNLKKIFTD